MSLPEKYRSETFEHIYGNESVIEGVKACLSREDVPPVYLFTGKAGTGKTSIANVIKNELKCDDKEYAILDAASDRGIDAIRQLKKNISMGPLFGNVKVILIDEAHSITGPAQEAMLKMLESPPPYVYFVLCTTEPQQLKDTILRRCTSFEMQPLRRSAMLEFLTDTCEDEDVEVPEKVLEKIESVSEGSAGMALKYLDSIIGLHDWSDAVELIEKVTVSEEKVSLICRTLLQTDNLNKWGNIQKELRDMGGEPEIIRRGILNYLNVVLLKQTGVMATMIAGQMAAFTESVYYSGMPGLNLAIFAACNVIPTDDVAF